MRQFILLSLVFSLTNVAYALEPNRAENAAAAEQALLNLDFFHKGRGMIMPPGFPPLSSSEPIRKVSLKMAAGILRQNYGILVDGDSIIGFKKVPYEGIQVGVVGCAMCHVGRAAGMTIVGLGNKNMDISALAGAAKKLTPYWNQLSEVVENLQDPRLQKTRQEVRAHSENFIQRLNHPQIHNLTQGLVPIGLIRTWFFAQANLPLDTFSPGQVKVPFLWGYGEKRKVGSFSDGGGNGVKPGWAIAVELVAGQTVENVREYEPKIHQAEDALANLLPPPYPFAIDETRVAAGRDLFEKNCSGCHGQYHQDNGGYPIFESPKFIPWKVIRTDAERLAGVTDLFREIVRTNPLNDLIEQTNLGPGYMAPRLNGVWARFPYLHNGSVPTIMDLLSPAAERPKYFSLRNAGEADRFDPVRLGLNEDRKWRTASLPRKAKKNDRRVYDVSRLGHSNEGHEFRFYQELSNNDKKNLIEYLKTL